MTTAPTEPLTAAARTVEPLLCVVVKTEAPVVCETGVVLTPPAPPVPLETGVCDEPFEATAVMIDEELLLVEDKERVEVEVVVDDGLEDRLGLDEAIGEEMVVSSALHIEIRISRI